jgi:hypothetical protein
MIKKWLIALFIVVFAAGGIANLAMAQDETPPDDWTGPEVREGHLWAPECDDPSGEPNFIIEAMAEYFQVPYEEILGWYCAGWPLWEINIAYKISQDTGVPVADLFAMRESGKTWHEIVKELGYEIDPDGSPSPLPIVIEKLCAGVTESKIYELAKEYGLPIDDVIALVCGEIEFGEIEGWHSITGIYHDPEKLKQIMEDVKWYTGPEDPSTLPGDGKLPDDVPWKDKLPKWMQDFSWTDKFKGENPPIRP